MALIVLNGPYIRAGESLSEGLDCSAGEIVRLTMPGAWDAASLSFQFSTDGAMYNELYHVVGEPESFAGFPVQLTRVDPGIGLVLPPNFARGIVWLKIRSGTRWAPVKQTEEREFAIAVEVPEV
jgi:hypothetical protein